MFWAAIVGVERQHNAKITLETAQNQSEYLTIAGVVLLRGTKDDDDDESGDGMKGCRESLD